MRSALLGRFWLSQNDSNCGTAFIQQYPIGVVS
jgi:hypothetical protein